MNALQNILDQLAVRMCVLLGLTEAAIERLNNMIARDATHQYALATRAQLRIKAGETAAALTDLQRAAEATPDAAFNASHVWYNLGYLLNESKHAQQAEAAFRKSLAINPKLDLSWYGLALVLIQQRRFDEAVDALKHNTKLQPMSPYGWYQLARVHVDRNAPEEAEIIIRHLKGFEPKFAAQLVRETGLGS